jgi:uncharacterized protein (DUF1697 family)
VNLGAVRRVAMADLRQVFEQAGLAAVASQGQSGNLVFEAPTRGGDVLETRLEKALAAQLGLTTEVFVRTSKDWAAMFAANPFPDEAREDPAHLVVMALRAAPEAAAQNRLDALARNGECGCIDRTWAWLAYPCGIADSRLTGAALDKALGVRGTGRNWNTVLKLAAMAAG